jgi:Tfp pilus assembly protein PilN
VSTPALNLATRPFRNERLPGLLLLLGFTLAGALTVKHALAVRELLPGRTSGLAREVAALEAEQTQLRSEAARLRRPPPEPGTVAQWGLLRELVDRRAFSWSGLFSVLEEVLPPGVRLVSIAPKIEKGVRVLDLTAVARSNEDALELIRVLEDRPEFEDVLPRTRTGESENEFRYTMIYHPRPLALATPPPSTGTPTADGAAASPTPPSTSVPPTGESPRATPEPARASSPTLAPEELGGPVRGRRPRPAAPRSPERLQ